MLGEGLMVVPATTNGSVGAPADQLYRPAHFPPTLSGNTMNGSNSPTAHADGGGGGDGADNVDAGSGIWYNWWDLSAKSTIAGNTQPVNLSTPVAYAPVYVRGGTVMPLLCPIASRGNVSEDATPPHPPSTSPCCASMHAASDGSGNNVNGDVGLVLLVALSDASEFGTAKGAMFVDDGVSLGGAHITAAGDGEGVALHAGKSVYTVFSVHERTLTGKPTVTEAALQPTTTSGGGVSGHAPPFAFSTSLHTVKVLGVEIGITALMLTTPTGTVTLPRSSYTWDGQSLILTVHQLNVDVTQPFTLQWTI